MAQYDGSIRINTNIDTSGLRQGEGEIKSSMGRIASVVNKFTSKLGAILDIGKIAEFGKEVIQAASDFEAMESQFSQVFGKLSSTASKSLSSVANQTGIVEERMQASYTQIAAFAKTMGMSASDSMDLANRAIAAVADSAAFYDRSLEETTESLQSFLKGNYENDTALGLSATEFTRNAAANRIYGRSFEELSEAQKQLTLMQMVEDANRLSGALGQASREADTWTNQTGNLSQAWTNMKANIGKFVLPIAVQAVKSITNVINAINIMLAKLYTAASAFRAFSELITGKKAQAGSSAGISKTTGTDIGAGYNEAAAGAENLASANDTAAKSAGKAAKAAKGQLSSLDKLNNLSSQNSGSSGGSGGGSSGSGMAGAVGDIDYGKVAEGETTFEKLGGTLDAIIAKVKELAGLFKKGFFEGFGNYQPRFEELKKDILSIGKTLKEIFTDPKVIAAANGFVGQLSYSLGQVVGSVASIGLTIAQLLVGGMEKYLTQNKDRIKQYIVSMLDIGTEIAKIVGNLSVALADIFSVFGGDTAQQIAGNLIGTFAEVRMLISETLLKLGRDIINMIAAPIIENKDKIKDAIEGTLQAIEPFTSGLLTAMQAVRDAVSNVYDNHLKPLFDSIAKGLSEILGKLLDGYNTYMLPVLQGLGQKFKEIMEGPFGETVNKVKDFMGSLVDAVKLLWENVLVPFFSWIAQTIMPVLAPIVNFMGNIVLTTLETIIKFIGNLADILGGIIEFVSGMFTGDWRKAWKGIEKSFGGTWGSIRTILSFSWKIIGSLVENGAALIKALLIAAWEKIKMETSIVWNAIKGIISTVWNGIKGSLKEIPEWFHQKFEDAKQNVHNAFNSIGDWFGKRYKDIQNSTKDVAVWFQQKFENAYKKATNAFSGIKKFFEGVWGNIKGAFGNITGWFKGEFADAWTAVKNVFSTGGQVFDGIKDGILSGLKSVVNAIISGINKVISIPFNGLNSSLGRLRSVKIGMISPFSWLPSIQVPHIPALATGGVIPPNREFLAVLGDQKHGTNIEAPLSTIEQAVENALKRNGGSGGIQEVTIKVPVEIDGRVLFELMRKFDTEQFRRTGRPSFQI